MNRFIEKIVGLKKAGVAASVGLLALATSHSVTAVNLAQSPLFMKKPVTPIMMLNLSNDHQLYFELYDDYSDLDGDLPGGDDAPETTYKNSFTYYGYFNSDYCYNYTSGEFRRSSKASNHQCSGQWSGNFLNWATMTRIDAVRKLLYGGKRFVDEAGRTVLERAYIPPDAHAFAKFYDGDDLGSYIPLNMDEVTICNVSLSDNGAPKMRVVSGNYSLWAAGERLQCILSGDIPELGWNDTWGTNGNDPDAKGALIKAKSDSPASSADYNVRVEVCAGEVDENNLERCQAYGSSVKPTGVLNAYGEDDSIHFGLMTGSYKKNKSGGVLRKQAVSFTNEINTDNGKHTRVIPGIISSIDALRIYEYPNNRNSGGNTGIYNNCGASWNYQRNDRFNNGQCVNWGNPQSELYYESLRYLAGNNNSALFSANDTDFHSALAEDDWNDPVADANSCAPLAVLQFNASTSSYDGDDITNTSSIGLTSVDTVTDTVGAVEVGAGNYFVGESGSDNNQLCTPKSIAKLSAVRGTCPDAPRLEGSYYMAGLAYHALTEGIADDRERVITYGVALAPPVPEINISTAKGDVTILPACRDYRKNGTQEWDAQFTYSNCALVDFKVIEYTGTTGKYLVNWEDSEQGGDFDQDLWGYIGFEVDGDTLKVTTDVQGQSTGDDMGFGYVISGTEREGFHVYSGINGYTGEGCENCVRSDNAHTEPFSIGSSSGAAKVLEQPLYYAAKWGGFDYDPNDSQTQKPAADEEPSNYYMAVRPQELESALTRIFGGLADMAGARASISTNSTRLQNNSMVFQSLFNSNGWWGDVRATSLTEDGDIGGVAWEASKMLPEPDKREILTYNGSTLVDFTWSNLNSQQKEALKDGDDSTVGALRVDWLRGENPPNAALRQRKAGEDDDEFSAVGDVSVIGDIVDSDPVFFGDKDYRYGKLSNHGGSSYGTYVKAKKEKTPIVYVQANDGKLHAFNANTGAEVFAFVPPGVYDKLAEITRPDYGKYGSSHIYTANGQVTVGDVYLGNSWRTYLVAAYGEGAEGIYVLDVTDPANPSYVGSLDTSDIGHVLGKAAIVPLPGGSDWAIVFGNGYHTSGVHSAKLIAVELNNGSLGDVTVFDTGASGDNGLAEPEFSMNGDGTVDKAYAGDLLGNMWRFDMSQVGAKNTNKAISKLFDTGGQPITAPPTVGLNPEKRIDSIATTMVYFGTGRYLTDSDISTSNTNSFYAVADTGETVEPDDLVQNSVSGSNGIRIVKEAQAGDNVSGFNVDGGANDFNWADEDTHGWYINFPIAGERVTDKSNLIFDRLIFPTIVPTENACDYGGKSWIMDLTAIGTFYRGNEPMLDNQGMESDSLSSLSEYIHIGGDGGTFIKQDSDGTLAPIPAPPPAGAMGRQSWRQMQ
ncbi:pilus assembly protein [Gilvimarinus xylanilyticus]|uniref:PilC/PilY family type IV pilus protein n=1 Tax=Gilvimarinus xylanilyticus TaxID=2944139 RepID=A0A9X2HZ13_9GAMM|nr:PilC/PilY family type IV pilus protein [Gilvimarinus xylanilyticus]MCP8900319.1 PilC/PilY family type IV pilus protein [Gilvimarinus xylanilyticus]